MLVALNGQTERELGLGFLSPGAGAAATGGIGIATAGIGLAIGAIGSIAQSLIAGASARKRDEIASGVWLDQSVDAIEEIETQVREQNITKAEAEKYFKEVLNKFKSLIVTLGTKSVVESRINNQTRDLENVFRAKMNALPDVAACAAGEGRWPATKKCVPLQCPAGTVRNQATGECTPIATSNQTQPGVTTPTAILYSDDDPGSNGAGLLILLAIGAGAIFLIRR